MSNFRELEAKPLAALDAAKGDRLEFSHGSRSSLIVGVPLLLLGGCAFLCVPMEILFSNAEPIGPFSPGTWLAGILTLSGIVITLGRSGCLIDRSAGQVTTWWGLGRPMKRKTLPLRRIDAVGLEMKEVHGHAVSRTVYPVYLEGPFERICLVQKRHYPEALLIAERVSQYLSVGIRDSSTGEDVLRTPGHPDRSLTANESATESTADVSEGSRLRCREEGDTVILEVAPSGFTKPIKVIAVSGLFSAIAGIGMLVWFAHDSGFDGFGIGLDIVFFFAAVVSPIAMTGGISYWLAHMRETIKITRRDLFIEHHSPFGNNSHRIPISDLEEIRLSHKRPRSASSGWTIGQSAIMARSDVTACYFGCTLAEDDKAWLLERVKQAIQVRRQA